MLLGISKYCRTTKLMHAMGIEPVDDFMARMRVGFYKRLAINPATSRLVKLAYHEHQTPKNKAQTVATELRTFVRTHTTHEAEPSLPMVDRIPQLMVEIQGKMEKEQREQAENADPEIRRLAGTGEWKERTEVVDANLRLNEILIAFEFMPSEFDCAFLNLVQTVMQHKTNI